MKRSRVTALLDGRSAAYSDMPREKYLRTREGVYLREAPLEPHPLMFTVAVGPDGASKIANPEYPRYWRQRRADPTEGDGPGPHALRSAAQEFIPELERLGDELARLTDDLEVLREAQDTREAQRDDAIATGEVVGDATMKRPPSHRGRPRLPFPWIPVLGWLAIAAIVLVEAYQFATPFLNWIGVDVSNLGQEWRRNPIGVVNGAGFALAASVSMLLLSYLLIRTAHALPRSWNSEGPGTTAARAVGVLLLGVLLVGLSYGMAGMRHGAAESSVALQQSQQAQAHGHGQTASEEMGGGVFVLLTIIVPFAAAYLQHRIATSAIWNRRRELSAERDRWDREECLRHLARDRMLEPIGLLHAKRNDIEHRREMLRAKRRALEERAQAIAHQRLVALEQERRRGVRFANDLYAALTQDDYYFVRAARQRKAYHLLDGQPCDHAHGHSPGLAPRDRSNGGQFTRSPS